MISSSVWAQTPAENVILITVDGLRVQEVFGGIDETLVEFRANKKRSEAELRETYWKDDLEERRERLMPFFWETVAKQGIVFGNPDQSSEFMVTNPHHFSYPGYSEMLIGFADPRINSNSKTPNPNVTVLEWLHKKPEFQGKVSAYTSWDVFGAIINEDRSGIPVNYGWMPLTTTIDTPKTQVLDQVAVEIPREWDSVRYDVFTLEGALEALRTQNPKVLYVSLGEPDDWAHGNKYDRYLESAERFDRSLQAIWQFVEGHPQYAGKTTIIIACDHGRGDTRTEWTSHSASIAGSDRTWAAMFGHGVDASTSVNGRFYQAQIAATVAAALGLDFCAENQNAHRPLPGLKQAPQTERQAERQAD